MHPTRAARLFVLLLALPPIGRAQTSTAPTVSVLGQETGAQLGGALTGLGDVNGDGLADWAVAAPRAGRWPDEGSVEIYLGGAGAVAGVPDLVLRGGQPGERFGASLAGGGDFDGDGFADLLVGSPRYDVGRADSRRVAWSGALGGAGAPAGGLRDAGRVRLYRGSATGLDPTPALEWRGEQAHERRGSTVAFAGDVNGDGFDDLAVGARGASGDLGAVYLHLGDRSATPASAPDATLRGTQPGGLFGAALAGAGDVDGLDDLLVGAGGEDAGDGRAFLFHGTRLGLEATPSWSMKDGSQARFGEAVAAAGDVNADGFADVLIGAPGHDIRPSTVILRDVGRAYVYLGGPAGLALTPVWTEESSLPGDELGASVAGVGDVDADGHDDVLIGAPGTLGPWTSGGTNPTGRAVLYRGQPAGVQFVASWSVYADLAGEALGSTLAGIGDVDGDGAEDLMVGSPGYSGSLQSQGRAQVFTDFARGAGPLELLSSSVMVGDDGYAEFGLGLSAGGDVNGDGFADVLVGAPALSNGARDEGAAYLFLGGPGGLDVVPAWRREGDVLFASFGDSVASLGDIDGDGFDDWAVSAPGIDSIFVYRGAFDVSGAQPAWVLGRPSALFGPLTLAAAGDVNGDGFADLLVGDGQFSGTFQYEGRVQLYLGSVNGFAASPSWERFGGLVNQRLGSCVAGAGDLNADGFDDVLVSAPAADGAVQGGGIVEVFLGGAAGLGNPISVLSGTERSAMFGLTCMGAGDVNGDGCGDVFIGSPWYGEEPLNGGSNLSGRVDLFLGSPQGVGQVSAWSVEGSLGYEQLGRSLSAGDFDGDGYSDLVFGSGLTSGEGSEGFCHLYLGGPSLVVPSTWSAQGSEKNAFLGSTLAPACDVDGDGRLDLVVGAYRASGPYPFSGAAFCFRGL